MQSVKRSSLLLALWASQALAQTTISAGTPSLTFNYQIGGGTPPNQTVSVTSASPASGVAYSVSQIGSCVWLTVTPSGATPGTITAQADPSGFGVGSYVCNIQISAPSASNSPDRKSTRLNSSHLGISYAVF